VRLPAGGFLTACRREAARSAPRTSPPAEADALRAILEPAEVPLDGRRCNMPARIEWWPTEMRGTINGERLAATGIHGYRSRKGSLIFAVNWNQGRAYYWSE